MKVQAQHIEKPLRKLHKQLGKFPSSPPPEDVHALRTQARRLEATVAALALGREKEPRRLLKLITPVRKTAGKVRDMDVFIADTLTLSEDQGGDAVVRLVEHLAEMRVRNARKLRDVISSSRSDIRKRLKQSSKLIRKRLKDSSATLDGKAAPRILITELSHWPELDEANLHLFRIRVKELRYMLQISEQADQKLIHALGRVKDTVGEWHDWVELLNMAGELLDPQSESGVLKQIEQIGKEKLQVAMAAANHLRARYFAVPDGRKASRKILPMAS